jgi:hypothetical protein
MRAENDSSGEHTLIVRSFDESDRPRQVAKRLTRAGNGTERLLFTTPTASQRPYAQDENNEQQN